jgi:hypothetical protein
MRQALPKSGKLSVNVVTYFRQTREWSGSRRAAAGTAEPNSAPNLKTVRRKTSLHVGFKGTMGALYLKDLADKTRRGLRGRVEAGRSGGGNSFGYDVALERRSDGEPERGTRTINEREAAIVRASLPTMPPTNPPRRSRSRSTGTISPVRRARRGGRRPSTATGAAGPASSTTSFILVVWSGTA